MLSKKLQKLLNGQLNLELFSAYTYYAMSAYMDERSLDGFSHWMKLQAEEELMHAQKIYSYLSDLGAKIEFLALEKPKQDFESVLDAFETALAHEKKLATELNEISISAFEERDNTTVSFLDWFLSEQVEEVAQTTTICDKLSLVGEDGHGILLLNNELRDRKREESTAE
ncbi:MAG: ferritin [Bdellovibrionales bacterium]|nr:ferritin [Bdellovibrionales bacterium]